MSKVSKCPICGHTDDWCNKFKSENGYLYGCHRVFNLAKNSKIIGFDNLTYILIKNQNNVGVFEEENQLNEAKERFKVSKSAKFSQNEKVLTKNRLIDREENKRLDMSDFEKTENLKIGKKVSKIYKDFLLLNDDLDDRAKSILLDEKWTIEMIEKSGYRLSKTDSTFKEKIIEKLLNKYNNLDNIPGFYMKDNKITYSMTSGILIPNKDIYGNIFSITTKPFNKNLPKYYYFSSTGKPSGAKASIKIASEYQGESFKKILITEGQKKAFVFNYKYKIPSFSINGVTNYNLFFKEDFLEFIKNKGVKQILVAFDNDYKSNKLVKDCLIDLCKKFEIIGYDTYVFDWDEDYKGIDDLILNNKKPKVKKIGWIK